MNNNTKTVSVIVATKDEEENIENCLRGIEAQNYPKGNLEIIVVDNGSNDRTKEIAKMFTDKVYNHGPERSAQRNLGVRQAKGEYILYLDADMSLSSSIISECVDRCENEGSVALYIPERIKGNSFWVKVRDFERSFYNATCIDCVRFTRRDKILEIGGFDETLTGPEDWDFDRRIREMGKIGIIDFPIYHDEGKFNFNSYLNKKAYYMQWFDKYIQKWGKDDPIVKKQLGFRYRYFTVFIERGKWRRLLRHPILALGMYILRGLVGLFMLCRHRCCPYSDRKSVLMISPFFSPNIGGVEAHLDSLCEYLLKNNTSVYVVTYQPITVNKSGLSFEQKDKIEIHRYPWFGRNLFFLLEKYFFLNFFYLSSGIFLYSLFFLIKKRNRINVIHAHGLNASFVSVILGMIFRKKVIVSLHTVYRLAYHRLLAMFIKPTLNRADKIMTLGRQGKLDLVSIGVEPQKIEVYNYWVHPEIFVIKDKSESRRKLNLPLNKFIGLFVGRFVQQKGLDIVTEALRYLNQKEFLFIFIGGGPQKIYLDNLIKSNSNVLYLGFKSNTETVDYYNAADVLLWGSLDNSYLGRVCIEALYCGLPVIGGNRCRIWDVDCQITDETLPSQAGFLINPEPQELVKTLKALLETQDKLIQMRSACRSFALEHYGLNNAEKIMNSYIARSEKR